MLYDFAGLDFIVCSDAVQSHSLSVVKFCKGANLMSSVVYTLVIQPQSVMPIRICELGLAACTLLFSFTQYHLITKQKAGYAAIVIKSVTY